MAYNKTKRCVKKGGKNKSSRKKGTLHKKKRGSSRKISSKMRKGGNPPSVTNQQLRDKFNNLKGDGAVMIANITSLEKLDMMDNIFKEQQPMLHDIFKDLIAVRRETLQGKK